MIEAEFRRNKEMEFNCKRCNSGIKSDYHEWLLDGPTSVFRTTDVPDSKAKKKCPSETWEGEKHIFLFILYFWLKCKTYFKINTSSAFLWDFEKK